MLAPRTKKSLREKAGANLNVEQQAKMTIDNHRAFAENSAAKQRELHTLRNDQIQILEQLSQRKFEDAYLLAQNAKIAAEIKLKERLLEAAVAKQNANLEAASRLFKFQPPSQFLSDIETTRILNQKIIEQNKDISQNIEHVNDLIRTRAPVEQFQNERAAIQLQLDALPITPQNQPISNTAQQAADAALAQQATDAALAQQAADAALAQQAADAALAQQAADAALAQQVADAALAQQVADAALAQQVADAALAQQVADAALAQQVADKAIADKAIADKAIADKAVADKAVADKAVADKAVADKAVAQGLVDSGASIANVCANVISFWPKLQTGVIEKAMQTCENDCVGSDQKVECASAINNKLQLENDTMNDIENIAGSLEAEKRYRAWQSQDPNSFQGGVAKIQYKSIQRTRNVNVQKQIMVQFKQAMLIYESRNICTEESKTLLPCLLGEDDLEVVDDMFELFYSNPMLFAYEAFSAQEQTDYDAKLQQVKAQRIVCENAVQSNQVIRPILKLVKHWFQDDREDVNSITYNLFFTWIDFKAEVIKIEASAEYQLLKQYRRDLNLFLTSNLRKPVIVATIAGTDEGDQSLANMEFATSKCKFFTQGQFGMFSLASLMTAVENDDASVAQDLIRAVSLRVLVNADPTLEPDSSQVEQIQTKLTDAVKSLSKDEADNLQFKDVFAQIQQRDERIRKEAIKQMSVMQFFNPALCTDFPMVPSCQPDAVPHLIAQEVVDEFEDIVNQHPSNTELKNAFDAFVAQDLLVTSLENQELLDFDADLFTEIYDTLHAKLEDQKQESLLQFASNWKKIKIVLNEYLKNPNIKPAVEQLKGAAHTLSEVYNRTVAPLI
jgi:hypothetical protein